MEDIIIKKKDLENFGKKLRKEVYKFLHYEYILTFEEMKVEKDKLEEYLIEFYFEMFDKSKYEKHLKEIEDKIEDESLDIDLIFEVLDRIELEFEIDEDLYDKKSIFIYLFSI